MMQKTCSVMHIFDYDTPLKKLLKPEVVRLLMQVQETKGRVHVHMQGTPAVLEKLREVAKVQSTGASNRIEGIVTTNARLQALMQQKTSPRNRSEEEIAGYRDVLNTIHEHYAYIPPLPSYILQMHRDLYAYCGKGGAWKTTDNVIAETDADGVSHIRFEPVPAYRTENAMEELCTAFQQAVRKGEAASLLLVPLFILDFLCIHPFFDGNGRMSRLLTTLLLYLCGYEVVRYISLEQLIDTAKEGYYGALQSSSAKWHDNENDYEPFVRYFLGIIIKAYAEMESRLESASTQGISKTDRVKAVFAGSLSPLSKADIADRCADISIVTIERTLNSLLKSGYLIRIGKGRNTAYIRNSGQENEPASAPTRVGSK